MSGFSLNVLLTNLHRQIEGDLKRARESFGHPGTKGDASEQTWIDLLRTYLPKRYAVGKAHVVDSNGQFSQQCDVVIYDRQYTPFVFTFKEQDVIPAEAVYAVFEAKQTVNGDLVRYAHEKIASVRKLHRTSLPIQTANGPAPAKEPGRILGGYLAFDSDWKPALGESLQKHLADAGENEAMDMGCIAAYGIFQRAEDGAILTQDSDKAATAFLLELMARLQDLATVPMIDVRAYAAWLVERPTVGGDV